MLDREQLEFIQASLRGLVGTAPGDRPWTPAEWRDIVQANLDTLTLVLDEDRAHRGTEPEPLPRPSDTWGVEVSVMEPNDGPIMTHTHEYDDKPLMLAVEADANTREFLLGDIATAHSYWLAMFGGCEFNLLTTYTRTTTEE
jgi:hypothetical protein